MKITKIEAIPYAIPYRKPLRFASGEVHAAEHVLVRVHTDDGVVGTADAPPRPFTYGETQAVVVAVIDEHLRPGRRRADPAGARGRARPAGPHGRQPGRQGRHRHGHLGRPRPDPRRPVTELLGGLHRPDAGLPHGRLRAPAADGRRGRADPRHLRHHHVQGEGRPPARTRLDVARCRALRDGLGPDVELYIDGNRGWTASESARALREMADLDLTFAEELCPADDVLGRRWLVAALPDPDHRRRERGHPRATSPGSCSAAAATAISIKTVAHRLHRPRQRILTCARASGVEVVMGNQIDGQLGSLCAAAFGAASELTSRRAGELSNFLDMTDDLLAEPLEICGGELAVRPGPGLGVEIDDDKLAHYRTDAEPHLGTTPPTRRRPP